MSMRRNRDGQEGAAGTSNAPVVDMFNRPVVGRKARRSAAMAERVRSGNVGQFPIVLFAHVRGDHDPFPKKWKFGRFTIGDGRPTWAGLTLTKNKPGITIPKDAVVAEFPRRMHRSELSTFSPNPRKTVVVHLESPSGNIFIAVQRYDCDLVLLALEPRQQRPGGRRTGPPRG
jgi:hypothetical protein